VKTLTIINSIILVSIVCWVGWAEYRSLQPRFRDVEVEKTYRTLSAQEISAISEKIYYDRVDFWVKQAINGSSAKVDYYAQKEIEVINQARRELIDEIGAENTQKIIDQVIGRIGGH
jgi:hypothetical protein